MNSAPDPADLPDPAEMVHGWRGRPWVPLAQGGRMTVVKKTNSLKLIQYKWDPLPIDGVLEQCPNAFGPHSNR